jgi:hypothetical protein
MIHIYGGRLPVLIILVAVVGKFLVAHLRQSSGHNWKNSLSIGTLMNTRGLVGSSAKYWIRFGVLSTEIFTMMSWYWRETL